MVLMIAVFLMVVVGGISVLTWGARRLNLGQRSMTIALAMTTLSWIVFLILSITSLVSLYLQQAA